jgi:hypothetical protein
MFVQHTKTKAHAETFSGGIIMLTVAAAWKGSDAPARRGQKMLGCSASLIRMLDTGLLFCYGVLL